MKKTIKIIFIVNIFVSFKSFASIEVPVKEIDPIDLEYRKCMANPQTNAEMINCAYDAYDSWDKTLNEVYHQILLKGKLINKKKFINSQRAWLKFRDAAFEVIDNLHYHLQGSMWIPIRVNDRFNIVKRRVKELRSYLAYINTTNDYR